MRGVSAWRGLWALLAAAGLWGGCASEKKPPPPAAKEVVLTVTVTGEVDATGGFRSGGFNVADQAVDGADVEGLAAAIAARREQIRRAGARMLLRVLVYADAPWGVVRRALAGAAKAQVAELALACIQPGSADRPAGVRFALPAADAVGVRIWPGPQGVNLVYAVADADRAVLGTTALRAALAQHRGAAEASIRPADRVTAGLVADAMGIVRAAGFRRVSLSPEPLTGPAPKLAAAPATAPAAGPRPPGPVAVGPRPPAGFAGSRGQAYHVVYLIDRSGSMVTTFETIRRELIRSIEALRPEQDFHVVFFGGRRAVEAPEKKLIPATDANKQAVIEFLKGVPSSGVTQPIPAIRRAFSVLRKADRQKPGKIIFLLTDGEFAGENRFTDNQAVLDALEMLNVDKDVAVHTLLLGRHSPAGEKILKTIAETHGGTYRFIEAE